MNILLLTAVFPPRTGGSGRWFWEIYRRLPRARVLIAADNSPGCEEFDRHHNLRVVRMPLDFASWSLLNPRSFKRYCTAYRQVARQIHTEGIATIHAGKCLPEGLLAWLLRRRFGLPYTCYVHGEELNYAESSRELRFWARRVFRGAERVIANSRNTEGLLRKKWGVTAEQLVVLHPGVDARQFVPVLPALEVRNRLGWGERPVVLTVSRLQKRKGHDMMIRALPAIRRAVPDVLYAIVGDGDERAKLMAMVAEAKLEDHVKFHGELRDADMLPCYQQCDLFALPNREVNGDIEGFGMVLLEAQACGKPVLAGTSGGTAETMSIPETGLVVPCDEPDPLAASVIDLLSNKDRLRAMGASARAWVERKFDWSKLSREAQTVFFPDGDETPRASLSSESAPLRVPILAEVPDGIEGFEQPVSFGVPVPRGALPGPVSGYLESRDGRRLPVQTEALARWSDGSVQWALARLIMPAQKALDREWTLVLTDAEPNAAEIQITKSGDRVLVDTGAMSAAVGPDALFGEVHCAKKRVLDSAVLFWTDSEGRECQIPMKPADVAGGAVRAEVRLHGTVSGKGGPRVSARVEVFQGSGLVKLEITLHNPRAARHHGGLWDLGDAGSVFFKELRLQLNLPADGTGQIALRPERSSARRTGLQEFELYQDSSGGANWQSQNHVNHQGRVPCRFRGYRVESQAFQRDVRLENLTYEGMRSEPVTAAGGVCVAVPDFWQQFPKAIECDGRTLRIGLFPRQWDDMHELQGGERKTHTVWLYFGTVAERYCQEFDWVFEPIVLRPTPAWIDGAHVLPPLTSAGGDTAARLDGLLAEALESERGILANRERVDEYGWRNYGDLFADHEQTHYRGVHNSYNSVHAGTSVNGKLSVRASNGTVSAPSTELISHYNNQFDPLDGFLLHFLRTGDRRWFELGESLAWHVADIDIYHTRDDRSAYNGGLFWFTDHYLHAATSSHRTYSRVNAMACKGYGGGPGASHNFTSGLLHHYYLTGSQASADAVVELADWVLAMDDGRNTILGVVDDGPTGLASATTAGPEPGRGAGNSLNALLDAWVLTRQQVYLNHAEELIRRAIHPADDVTDHDLLDVEKRWSYTVFLSSLAKYLDVKAETERLDAMYAYARASLVHYAEWMARHERPYFDQIEKLEFPTEAWAAQEFRKANVLRKAARHADEPLRAEFLRRGEELAERAWQDLLRFDTRIYIRAIAIVMNEGLWDCAFRANALEAAPKPHAESQDFGRPQRFPSQRQRIMQRLRSPLGVAQMMARLLTPWRWLNVRLRLK